MASEWQTQFGLPARMIPATGSPAFFGPSMPGEGFASLRHACSVPGPSACFYPRDGK